jgi:hypothetical protein
MSRKKRSSKVITAAQFRATGLRTIDPTLDLGHGLTVDSFSELLDKTRSKLDAYNAALSAVDQTYGEFRDAEKNLSASTNRVLLGVAFKYGKSSTEYEVASGKSATTSRRRSQSAPGTVSPKTIGEPIVKPAETESDRLLAISNESLAQISVTSNGNGNGMK